jgi:glucose-6-phosphate 1-dehydrogenase
MELDRTLHRSFGERQIFRIDHYLAKETVQNVLTLRFANAIFEPLWNRNFVDHVGILAAENLGVEHRAGYYDRSGVLRDMFQNHLMQLLALIAMEPPSRFESDRVQDEKAKVFRSLKPLPAAGVHENLILGQYGPGIVEGGQALGYREEPGVRPDSVTPTFAVLRLFLDNWRWRGVPFYLASGKRLAQKVTEITVQFKEVPHSMFQSVLGERIIANRLILGIYPDEGIRLTFQTKNPGAQMCLRSVLMDFKYYHDYRGLVLDAYDKALVDCIQGDHMLFWRRDAVELCWAFLTPILEECEACGPTVPLIHPYEAGTWGPEAARSWMSMMLE